MGLTIWYFLASNAIYPGVVDNIGASIWAIPLAAIIQLTQCKKETPSPSKTSKIFTYLFMFFLLAITVALLVHSHGYNYYGLVGTILMIFAIIFIHLEFKHGPKPKKDPIVNWSLAYLSLFSFFAVTLFLYLQILAPLPIDQVTAQLADQFPEKSCKFAFSIDGYRENSPLGGYYFKITSDESALGDIVCIHKQTGEHIPQ